MDGWMDGWTDGRTDRQTDRQKDIYCKAAKYFTCLPRKFVVPHSTKLENYVYQDRHKERCITDGFI
jgi:hypothetical protein